MRSSLNFLRAVSKMPLQTVNIELEQFIKLYKPYLIIVAKNKANEVTSIVGWIEGETWNYPLQTQAPENWKEIIEKAGYTLINVQYDGCKKILMFKVSETLFNPFLPPRRRLHVAGVGNVSS